MASQRRQGRLLAVALAAATVALLALGGCSAGPDPYELAQRARTASWDRIAFDVALALEITPGPGDFGILPGQAQTIRIDPGSVVLTLEPETGRWHVHLSIETAALGLDPFLVGQLGGPGDSLELDATFDGTSLFARGSMVAMYLGSLQDFAGLPADADLDGWVRIGSIEEYRELEAAMGNVPGGMAGLFLPLGGFGVVGTLGFALPEASDAAGMRDALESMGVGLSHVGGERRDDVETEHVAATLNVARLLEQPSLAPLGPEALRAVFEGTRDLRVGLDLWFETASGRLWEAEFRAATPPGDDGGSGRLQVVIAFREPPPDGRFDAPAVFEDAGLFKLLLEASDEFLWGGGIALPDDGVAIPGGGVDAPEVVPAPSPED